VHAEPDGVGGPCPSVVEQVQDDEAVAGLHDAGGGERGAVDEGVRRCGTAGAEADEGSIGGDQAAGRRRRPRA
jgi:hypothetical protein